MRKPEEIQKICEALLIGQFGKRALDVNVDEFQKFYTTMVHLTKSNPVVSFVNLETMVVAQFSNISPQHFDIAPGKRFLTETDFDFVINRKWYGARNKPQRFGWFLWNEFLLNKRELTIIFTISALALFIIDDIVLYEQLVSLLIQSATVFLSIYIIFTVSQSQTLYRDITLFKNGILQKYYRDDRNTTLLGIITIGLTFLGSSIVSLTSKVEKTYTQVDWVMLSTRAVRAFVLAVVVVMLFDTFFAVANYYLVRNKDVLERDMVADILDEDYKEYGMKK